ncbi:hypothetical protein EON63_17740 [archaeon]|nr:MAG: hypothetical protein EON63_17740 [archaeon]
MLRWGLEDEHRVGGGGRENDVDDTCTCLYICPYAILHTCHVCMSSSAVIKTLDICEVCMRKLLKLNYYKRLQFYVRLF